MFLLLYRPDPFLQLDQASHVWREVVLLAARWRLLVAAVLLVLVGHHLLDAYHGLGFTDQRHLMDVTIVEEKESEPGRLTWGMIFNMHTFILCRKVR